MAGRKPIPTYLQLLKNDKAHAHKRKDEPEADPNRPVPPATLSADAVVIFERMVDRLEELGIASASHTEMLAIYAYNEELCTYLDKDLRENGLSDVGEKGRSFARPEVGMLQDAQNRCIKILQDFGLSPSASVRVKANKPKPKANPFAELGKTKEVV